VEVFAEFHFPPLLVVHLMKGVKKGNWKTDDEIAGEVYSVTVRVTD
jgi:hypothetical protein